jgi:alcohol dehydrogenase YqhD (iron-dependent ADH family)
MQFTFHNPTKIIFGAGSLEQLGEIVSSRGKRALLVTGGSTMDASQVIAAAPATAMSHIAVQEQMDGSSVEWFAHVTDEAYGVQECGGVTRPATRRF